jgi:hypothetical protein
MIVGRPTCAPVELTSVAEGDVSGLAPSGGRAAAATSGGSFQLTCLTRLRVVTLPTQIRQNSCFLYLLLEALERPVQAIIITELNLDQGALSSIGWVVGLIAGEDARFAPTVKTT